MEGRKIDLRDTESCRDRADGWRAIEWLSESQRELHDTIDFVTEKVIKSRRSASLTRSLKCPVRINQLHYCKGDYCQCQQCQKGNCQQTCLPVPEKDHIGLAYI